MKNNFTYVLITTFIKHGNQSKLGVMVLVRWNFFHLANTGQSRQKRPGSIQITYTCFNLPTKTLNTKLILRKPSTVFYVLLCAWQVPSLLLRTDFFFLDRELWMTSWSCHKIFFLKLHFFLMVITIVIKFQILWGYLPRYYCFQQFQKQ